MNGGSVTMRGNLNTKVIHAPTAPLAWKLSNWMSWSKIKSLLGVFVVSPVANKFGLTTAYGKLELTHIKANGDVVRYGVVDYRVVTTAFVDFVTDQLQTETSVFGDYKYHDSGVGTTDPAITDTAIETTDGESRATGTQTESAHNVYVSVGTISYTTGKAITEHGLFNDASAGTLLLQTSKNLSGTLTSDGSLLKRTTTTLSGVVTSSGDVIKRTYKSFVGDLTSSGIVGTLKASLVAIGGTLTTSGDLIKQTNKIVSGILNTSGTVTKLVRKILSGILT